MPGREKDSKQKEATKLWALGRAYQAAEGMTGADHSERRAEISAELERLNSESESSKSDGPSKS